MYHYWRVWQLDAAGQLNTLFGTDLYWQVAYIWPERLWS